MHTWGGVYTCIITKAVLFAIGFYVINIHRKIGDRLVDTQTYIHACGQMRGLVSKAIPTALVVDSNKTVC